VCGESVRITTVLGQVGVVFVLAGVLCGYAISLVRSGGLASCNLMESYLLCAHK
jgi:hypothetical protein